MGGQTALFAGTTIAYSAKWQITVTTSSTEAEFDNATAIMMANNSRPNGQTQHIDISYFALQEWFTYGNVKLAQICRITNQADALTKALGWMLHQRH
eukprot:10818417-Ditylum_brightwellii.AAC.1